MPSLRGHEELLGCPIMCLAHNITGYCPRMDIDWNAEVVDQLESHWQHQLRPRLNGLTDDEYF